MKYCCLENSTWTIMKNSLLPPFQRIEKLPPPPLGREMFVSIIFICLYIEVHSMNAWRAHTHSSCAGSVYLFIVANANKTNQPLLNRIWLYYIKKKKRSFLIYTEDLWFFAYMDAFLTLITLFSCNIFLSMGKYKNISLRFSSKLYNKIIQITNLTVQKFYNTWIGKLQIAVQLNG